MNIRTLRKSIVKNDFAYTLVERTNEVAIYEQYISRSRRVYEVFRIKTYSPKKVLARIYQDKGKSISELPDLMERFPSNEDFGKTAFVAFDLTKAYEIFEALKPGANHKAILRNWKKTEGIYV